MPNLCQNDLTINANTSVIEKFEELMFTTTPEADDPEKIGTKKFSLGALIPMPTDWDAVEIEEEEDNMPKWYTWCSKYWGTKAIYEITSVTVSTRLLHVSFESAWSPPLPWFTTLCNTVDQQNANGEFTATLSFSEPMMQIDGVVVCKKWETADGSFEKQFRDVFYQP